MNTHSLDPTECFLEPKDLEQLILKLRELVRALDEEPNAGYISEFADDVCTLGSELRAIRPANSRQT